MAETVIDVTDIDTFVMTRRGIYQWKDQYVSPLFIDENVDMEIDNFFINLHFRDYKLVALYGNHFDHGKIFVVGFPLTSGLQKLLEETVVLPEILPLCPSIFQMVLAAKNNLPIPVTELIRIKYLTDTYFLDSHWHLFDNKYIYGKVKEENRFLYLAINDFESMEQSPSAEFDITLERVKHAIETEQITEFPFRLANVKMEEQAHIPIGLPVRGPKINKDKIKELVGEATWLRQSTPQT